MITREDIISKVSQALAGKMETDPDVTFDQLATISLDTIMDDVAEPLCSAVESVSPFGKLISDQIKSIAGRQ